MKKVDLKNPKNGDLIVWWIPQIPMKAFHYPVNSPQEAFILLDALAEYDLFQYENNVKPDYCNAGGLMVFDEELIDETDEDDIEFGDSELSNGWSDWSCEFSGENMDYYLREENGFELLINDLKEQ
jgi:hypothetical protein